jgi:hypothetical protein
MRAEPISLLYEKGRALHRRGLDQLEAEMMAFSREWDRAVDGSPNRLDAAVWSLTRLSKVLRKSRSHKLHAVAAKAGQSCGDFGRQRSLSDRQRAYGPRRLGVRLFVLSQQS